MRQRPEFKSVAIVLSFYYANSLCNKELIWRIARIMMVQHPVPLVHIGTAVRYDDVRDALGVCGYDAKQIRGPDSAIQHLCYRNHRLVGGGLGLASMETVPSASTQHLQQMPLACRRGETKCGTCRYACWCRIRLCISWLRQRGMFARRAAERA